MLKGADEAPFSSRSEKQQAQKTTDNSPSETCDKHLSIKVSKQCLVTYLWPVSPVIFM